MMTEGEPVVVQASTVMEYSSDGHASADHFVHYSTTVSDIAAVAGESTTSAAFTDNLKRNSRAKAVGGSGVSECIEMWEAGSNSTLDYDSMNVIALSEQMIFVPAGNVENGVAVNETGGVVTEQQPEEQSDKMMLVKAISTEEDRLWSNVRANCLDFDSWTALIQETEKISEKHVARDKPTFLSIVDKNEAVLSMMVGLDIIKKIMIDPKQGGHIEDNIQKIRKVYDAFLAEFPLCYGYWKKYADHEARLSMVDKVIEVYEQAVQAVTYSVDIWLHYCMFAMSAYGDPETVRRLFERGLAYVGTDYSSCPLWDKYIEYEYSQQEWSRLALIYTQILESPIPQLDRYFNRLARKSCTKLNVKAKLVSPIREATSYNFKELVASRPLSEIQTTEETAVAAASLEANSQGADGQSNDVEQAAKPISAGLTEAEELEKYISVREEIYKKTKEFDSKIIHFESAIRRPYFHAKPLDDAQLDNWHSYLDFIEREGDFHKIVKLYERCLIACASYPEYWIRYVLCMEVSGSMELASNALARATQLFVKRQPEMHLFAGRFKERTDDISGARVEYQLLYSELSPSMLEAIIKHASMEYRLDSEPGNLDAALGVYEKAIATEKGKEQSQILPMLLVQYSRFLHLSYGNFPLNGPTLASAVVVAITKVTGNVEKARETLTGILEHMELSRPVLEALIHLESIQSLPKRIDFLDSLVDKFIMPKPDNTNVTSITEREELSSIFLEFLDLFGDPQSIKKAENRHMKLFLHQRSISESRKRRAEEYLASNKAKLAKSYEAVPAQTQSLMGAYPSAQNQWPAGYGVQPQGWTQASQAQGQQWNPAYAQQAGYGGYSGYGSYPQISTTTPQGATTYTYPSAYPPGQTFPPQSYAQAAAPALTPAQQQTPEAMLIDLNHNVV
ncbi:hypothetical protein ACLOJK_011231 [Asimina triloba]